MCVINKKLTNNWQGQSLTPFFLQLTVDDAFEENFGHFWSHNRMSMFKKSVCYIDLTVPMVCGNGAPAKDFIDELRFSSVGNIVKIFRYIFRIKPIVSFHYRRP